ncbi:MAG: helix-turn-helix domain-containing protein [Prevotella sp.]|jgi:AraC-like DNA-binding protein|nr:helix-turn-helix domain-containing protein [Prevotella sp.]
MVYYILLFRKKYAQYLKQLDDYYDEDEDNRLRWVKVSFYMALCIGVLALFMSYLPLQYVGCFISAIIIFYIFFAIKYSNYPLDFHYIISAVYAREATLPITLESDISEAELLPLSEKEQKLQYAIDKWVEEKQYQYADVSRDDIAKGLGTDRNFLTYFFHNRMKIEFRVWRTQLRIEEAKELLIKYPDLSISKVGCIVGITDRSNFQKKFRGMVGLSPKNWRKENLKMRN